MVNGSRFPSSVEHSNERTDWMVNGSRFPSSVEHSNERTDWMVNGSRFPSSVEHSNERTDWMVNGSRFPSSVKHSNERTDWMVNGSRFPSRVEHNSERKVSWLPVLEACSWLLSYLFSRVWSSRLWSPRDQVQLFQQQNKFLGSTNHHQLQQQHGWEKWKANQTTENKSLVQI